jgi:iron complex transport system substrate-binding protein
MTFRLHLAICAAAIAAATASSRADVKATDVNATDVNVTKGCIDRFDRHADYFPDKAVLEDAAMFRVEYRRSYKVLSVNGGQPGDRPERYVLVQCGAPTPPLTDELAGATVVSVPVSSVFAFSTTQLPLLTDLNRIDVLTGVAQRDAITDPDIQRRVASGAISEFARVGLVIDVERVVAVHPSLLLIGSSSNRFAPPIRAAGIPVVPDAEWLERTALGRAEWIKYMAVFLNEEARAQSAYGAIKARYASLAARARAIAVAQRPVVMTGHSSNGMFTISGGRSYVAALIADAGGRYAWNGDTSPGILTVDMEAQIARAAGADIWINGGGWKNLDDMVAQEPRYTAFKAFRDGRVWVYERRQTSSGANDYWSRSVTRPDVVLADLIKIFHPGLARDHTFEWYMPVPGSAAR